MKNIFLTVAFFCAIAFQAKADPTVLLQYKSATTVVTIQSDGKVLSSKEILGQLTDAGLANLVVRINSLNEKSEVTDPSPKAPICMDVPMTTITATQANGKNILVFKNLNCHQYESDDPATETLSTVMMGFVALIQ